MIRKASKLEFVVPTVWAIALTIMLSIYLCAIFLEPIEQAEAHRSVAGTH
jgi:hypothetical protein